MIRIWRAMEKDVCGAQGEGAPRGGREKRSRELARSSRVSSGLTPRKSGGGERDGAAADSDLTTITEESAGLSPLKSVGLSRSAGLKAARRTGDQEGGLLR